MKKMFLLFSTVALTSFAHAQCVAGFTFTVNSASVSFTNTSSGAALPVYNWDFGDAGNSSLQNPSHFYNTAGTYTVSLTITDSLNQTCTNTYSSPVTVTAGCNNLSVSATSTAASACATCDGTMSGNASGGNAGYTYLWSNSATAPTLTSVCAGDYLLTVTDAIGCAATANVHVACPDSCVANFSSNVSGLTVFLNNTSNDSAANVNFQWDFGDSNSSTMINPASHNYAIAGTYTITLIMNDVVNACTDTARTVVNPGGPASCYASFNLQQDSSNLLQWYAYGNASGQPPFTYLWDFGDTTTSTIATPQHNYAYACHHVICLTVTDANGCVSMYCDSSASHRMSSAAASTLMQYLTVVSMTETATGIMEHDVVKIKVWPNPSGDFINISLGENTEGVLRITDLPGNIVLQQKINANEFRLDVSNLPAGCYNLNISNAKMNQNRKIVIIR
ncbi:MAG: PKD domain-containing protein [Bacteroidetes bacterium]|nr:PKD domain-containing protein [Bacteroidota bacterium]